LGLGDEKARREQKALTNRGLRPHQLDNHDRRLRPGTKNSIPARDQAVAVELRRRNEQGVMKAMPRLTIREARHDPASANGDRSVDRVDAIGEARDDLVEPFALRVGALRL
jgi:hypothetical protein